MASKLEDLASHREARQGRDVTKRGAKAHRGCPICGVAVVDRFRPFCSRRCADLDLNRWLGEVYVVPGDAAPPPLAGSGADEEDE